MSILGEDRSFGVSLPTAVVKSSPYVFSEATFPMLKREVEGIQEWKMLTYRLCWEPLVVANSASNVMVGVVGFMSHDLQRAAGSNLDDLLRAGMTLFPASSRRTIVVNIPERHGLWHDWDENGPAFYVYTAAAATSTAPLGRITGVAHIRVRGVRGTTRTS